MRNIRARGVFAGIGLVLVVAVPGYSQKPLAQVTQQEIRDSVAKWLKENAKEFGLDANGLEYMPPGPLVWKLQAKLGEKQAKDFLNQALQTLIKDEDLKTLVNSAQIEAPPDGIPQPGGNALQPGGGSNDALKRALARAEDAATRAAAAEAAADHAAAVAAWRAKAADATAARAAVVAARARAALDAAACAPLFCTVPYDL
jgi:hypothetical protein